MEDNLNRLERSMFESAVAAEKEGLVDQRHIAWVVHPCSLILMMISVGLLFKRITLRAINRLFHDQSTAPAMNTLFEPYFKDHLKEHGFPSLSCLDRFLQTADTEALALYLCQWSIQLTDDDGTTLRPWGVDGQAARGSKLVKDGGKPKYNVDYHDIQSNILVFMASVKIKSQESIAARDTVEEVLSGHPNVALGADAMMTKKGILEGAKAVGAKTFMPIKRNNPILMNGFSKTIEELTMADSSAVEHYTDLNGSSDGVGCEIIRDTICTYEEEDNKKYDQDLRSRPIRELVFFDNVYPYYKRADGEGDSDGLINVADETQGKWFRIDDERYIVLSPDHGRFERREYDLITDPDSCDIWKDIPEELKREWNSYIKTVCAVTRYRAVPDTIDVGKGKDKTKAVVYRLTITRTIYGFNFIPESVEAAASLVRGYWAIEGSLHKVVDDILGQDACTCRVGNSTGNMSLLRKIAFNVLSGAKNAVQKMTGREIGYTDVLDTLSLRSDLIFQLLFEKPTEAFMNYAKACYQATV